MITDEASVTKSGALESATLQDSTHLALAAPEDAVGSGVGVFHGA